MEYDDLINRIMQSGHRDDEEYLRKLKADIKVFLGEDHPIEQKREFSPLGYLEVINMLLSGIEYRKGNE